jgi:hypothetical protein
MNNADPQFAVCVKNDIYPASLELRKLYQVIPDAAAAGIGRFESSTSLVKITYIPPRTFFLCICRSR